MHSQAVTYRQHLTQEFQIARRTLLGVSILTVVNLILLLTESDQYLLFAASVPYYLTYFGYAMDSGALFGAYTLVGLALGCILVTGYFLFWILSAKRPGWLLVGAVCLWIDLAVLVALSFRLPGGLGGNILDVILHIVAAWQIGKGASAGKKLQTLPPEQAYEVIEPDL